MKIVISLGGSIFSGENGIDLKYVKNFSRAILDASKQHRIFIVTGGGKIARQYIEVGRDLGVNEDVLDALGILATRLNAMVISSSFGQKGLSFVPEKVEDVDKIGGEKIFVMGGTVPGHTTDTVSAMLAVHVGADLFINATNVDGVYERDPKKDPGAKRLERISSKELLNIVKISNYKAGTSSVIDPKAAQLIHKNQLKTVIVDGREIKNIIKAIEGEIKGTVVEG